MYMKLKLLKISISWIKYIYYYKKKTFRSLPLHFRISFLISYRGFIIKLSFSKQSPSSSQSFSSLLKVLSSLVFASLNVRPSFKPETCLLCFYRWWTCHAGDVFTASSQRVGERPRSLFPLPWPTTTSFSRLLGFLRAMGLKSINYPFSQSAHQLIVPTSKQLPFSTRRRFEH